MTRVGNLQLGCGLMLFIIAASPLTLRAAPTATSVRSATPPVVQKSASPVFPSAQLGGSKPAMPTSVMPAVATAAVASSSAPSPAVVSSPLQLRLEPMKSIFSSREGVVMQFIFTAQTKTKLCLDKDILSQMSVSLFRAGQGKLSLQPIVIQDNSQLFMQPMRVVWLAPGQKMTIRANLKRFQLDGGATWLPGEYSADATFNLCEQTPVEPVTEPGREISVKAVRPGWFMIME